MILLFPIVLLRKGISVFIELWKKSPWGTKRPCVVETIRVLSGCSYIGLWVWRPSCSEEKKFRLTLN